MLKFFRKIRQRLLTENKFSKYLIYAIGEIVLVVIGILIALQINNWNENRINENNETIILETLQEEFLENKKRYSETIKQQSYVIKYCKSLIECLELKDSEYKRDSIGDFIHFGALNYFRAEPLVGSYQSMLGSGDLKLLKNEGLKAKLASFSAEINTGFEDETASMNLLNQLHLEFKSIGEELYPNQLRQRLELAERIGKNNEERNKIISELYQNPNILNPLYTKAAFEKNRLDLQKKMLNYSNEILDLIETELNHKK
ncbi:DUF6090 family protein [Sabulilitoribacter multivorans]|uniref:DUF6090 family protein n=1 Tax=Flaviramulus multivorans TaxID=1304750 RepID=A0ABS9IHA1_9FLAO|nr:DUF6090 family protein [Flaviramulus multivorans]MCF7560143.1 DUF6090 family protein [Flaviramulus multivorans]